MKEKELSRGNKLTKDEFLKEHPSLVGEGYFLAGHYFNYTKEKIHQTQIDKQKVKEAFDVIKRRQRQWYDEHIVPILLKIGISKKELGLQ